MFRDKLIANKHFRRRYEMIKLQNCKDKDIDSVDYALAKSDFISIACFVDNIIISIAALFIARIFGMTESVEGFHR